MAFAYQTRKKVTSWFTENENITKLGRLKLLRLFGIDESWGEFTQSMLSAFNSIILDMPTTIGVRTSPIKGVGCPKGYKKPCYRTIKIAGRKTWNHNGSNGFGL